MELDQKLWEAKKTALAIAEHFRNSSENEKPIDIVQYTTEIIADADKIKKQVYDYLCSQITPMEF